MPIQITTKRGSDLGSIPNLARPVKMAIVGESLGESILVTDEATSLSVSDGTVDTLSVATISSITKVALGPNDQTDVYTETTDYAFTAPNKITWTSSTLTPPVIEGTVVSSGGTIDTTARYYAITVLDQSGTGESTPSATISVAATSGATNLHRLEWARVSFASGYKVYGSADGTNNWMLEATIASGNTLTCDITSFSATPATVPAVNEALKRPPTGTTYYASYIYTATDNSVLAFTNLYDVQQKHGIGSDLANMARILFNDIGVPEIYIVATTTNTNAAYMAAIDKLVSYNVQYVVALKESTTVQDYVVQHARTYSQYTQKKYRFGVVGYSNAVRAVGTTLINRILSFNTEMRAIVVIPSGNKMYMNIWQTPTATTYDGTTYAAGDFINNYLVNNQFVAGAVAGLYIVAEDEATSIIGVTLPGFNFGSDSGDWNDAVEKDKLEAYGATYILNKNGTPVVYNDNTNDTTMTENAERSVVSAEDKMRRQLELDNTRFLGKKITKGLILAIQKNVEDTLNRLAGDFIINRWGNLTVQQNATVKTKVDVAFNYLPVYPLKELAFSYSFDLGTV